MVKLETSVLHGNTKDKASTKKHSHFLGKTTSKNQTTRQHGRKSSLSNLKLKS